MDISFDMIVYTLTERFHSDLQQIRILNVFHTVRFLIMSKLPVRVQNLGICNSKPCSILKLLLMLLVLVNNGGNKRNLMCKSIPSRGSTAKHSQNQNLTGVYPIPVSMKLIARKYIICDVCFPDLKVKLFSCVLVILTAVQTEWHANDSQM